MRDVGDRFCHLVLQKLSLSPDDEVQVNNLAEWQESINYFMGADAAKTPTVTVALIALFGDVRPFTSVAEADITLQELQNIAPLVPRLYSISVVQNSNTGHVRFLYLTVHLWQDGVASRLLVLGKPGTEIVCQVIQSRVLRRLEEGKTIYFASGSGNFRCFCPCFHFSLYFSLRLLPILLNIK